MTTPQIEFGDYVRVLPSPETQKTGLAGLTGQVYGLTTVSVSGVDVIGCSGNGVAINVYIDGQDSELWFAPELLEFVDRVDGMEVMVNGVTKKWARNAEGAWDETDETDTHEEL